jgi:hypothetical protein
MKITKKWKWEGGMHIGADQSKYRLCQVKITDSSDLPGKVPESSSFDMFFEEKDIYFERLQDVEDFRLIFSSRQRPSQVAVVTASDSTEQTSDFRQLAEHMYHKKQVRSGHIFLCNMF